MRTFLIRQAPLSCARSGNELVAAPGVVLDFETTPLHNITVRMTDTGA
jgi:hypothetical protein